MRKNEDNEYGGGILISTILQPKQVDTVVLAENSIFKCEVTRNDGPDHRLEKALVQETIDLKIAISKLKEELQSLKK